MHITGRVILCALLCITLCETARAQVWTRFRGPNGTGLSNDTFPVKWTDSDYAWKVELPGGGHSSPVLWGNKIFLNCGNDQTGEMTLVSLNADSGAVIWKAALDAHTYRKHADNSYASSTPSVDADEVYVCWTTPEALQVAAFSHEGKKLWDQQLGEFISQHGGGQSPLVVGDVVLVSDLNEGPKSFLFGLDRKTGQIRWKAPRERSDKFCPSTPCIYQPAGSAPEAIFLSKAEGVTAIDPMTGRTIWQARGVFDARTVSSPVLSGDGLIFASCGDNGYGHQLVGIKPGSEGKPGTSLWSTTEVTPYVPTCIAKNGLLFCWVDAGIVQARRQETGQIVWQERVPGSYYSSPVCAGDTLFNITRKGEVIAIAASDKFQLLGQTPLNEKCQATPAIVDGKMYVRTYTHLYCIKGKHNQ